MRRILLISVSVWVVLTTTHIQLSACDCDMHSVPVAYNEAQTVVLGTVISIEEKTTVMSLEIRDSIQKIRQQKFFSDTVQYTVYTFRIDRKIKVAYVQDTIQIIVGPSRSDCDFIFEMSKSYVLYAMDVAWKRLILPEDGNIPYFFTSVCMRTTEDIELEMKLLKNYGYWN